MANKVKKIDLNEMNPLQIAAFKQQLENVSDILKSTIESFQLKIILKSCLPHLGN